MKNYSLFDISSVLNLGDSYKVGNEKIIIFEVSTVRYNPNTLEPIKMFKVFRDLKFQIAFSRPSNYNLPYKFLSTRMLLLEINYKKNN